MRIATALGVSPVWLLHGEGKKEWTTSEAEIETGILVWDAPEDLPPDENRVWISSYDFRLSAGNGHIQWEIREKQELPFDRKFFRDIGSKPTDCKIIDVHGDSMEPYLFSHDMVMIDIAKTIPRDGKVYAVLFEEEGFVKQIFKESGGGLRLHSYNALYPDRIIPREHLDRVQILGQVVYRAGSGMYA
ncbi:S24 family peptidase [Robbsia andropogonis]|uniref:S24 family peptidase n=1 Tax=Robbsia andropogonis TaxID=28092 RepID=UPI003D23EEB8